MLGVSILLSPPLTFYTGGFDNWLSVKESLENVNVVQCLNVSALSKVFTCKGWTSKDTLPWSQMTNLLR